VYFKRFSQSQMVTSDGWLPHQNFTRGTMNNVKTD